MFDIGFPEILLVSIVALLVFGPERLPEVLRTLGGWIGSAKRSFGNLKAEIEREVGADDIRRDLHNNRVMEEVRELEQQMRGSRDEVEEMLGKGWSRGEGPTSGPSAESPDRAGDEAADRADDAGLEKSGDDGREPVDPPDRGADGSDDAGREDRDGERPPR
jgi:sec-independent protein translocase protein TatB